MGADPAESGLASLAELLERIPDLFRQSWDAIGIYGLDGRIFLGNRKASTLVGDMDLVGRHFFAHMGPAERARTQLEFEQTIRTQQPREFESIFSGADGARINVEIRLIPAHFDGVMVGVYGLARDVTARKRYEREMHASWQRLLSLFENHPDSITMLDLDGRYQMVNRAALRLTGLTGDQFIGRTVTEVFDPENPQHFQFLLDGIKRGERFDYESSSIRADGTALAVEATLIPILIEGELLGAFNAAKDVTAKRRYEARLVHDGERMRHLYQIASASGITSQQRIERALRDGMMQLGADGAFVARIRGDVVTVDNSVGAGYGFAAGYTVDLAHSFVRHVVTAARHFLVIEDLRLPPWHDDPSGRAEVWRGFVGIGLMIGGKLYGVAGFVTKEKPLNLEETDRDYIAAIAALIAVALERTLQYQQLNDLAHQDALTGLPNRALLLDRIDQTLLQSRRYKRAFALHFIDFDDFKLVNDQFGHLAGDQLLIAATAALAGSLRESDTLARVGGDEFVVLQPEIGGVEDANTSRERLCAAVLRPFVLEKTTLEISVSAGTAVFPEDGGDAAALLEAADQRLYRAKALKKTNREFVEITHEALNVVPTSYASLHHLICHCGHTAFSHGTRGCRVPTRTEGRVRNCPCVRTLEQIYADSAKPRRRKGEAETSVLGG